MRSHWPDICRREMASSRLRMSCRTMGTDTVAAARPTRLRDARAQHSCLKWCARKRVSTRTSVGGFPVLQGADRTSFVN